MIRDARYLLRISHAGAYAPSDHAVLSEKVRALARPYKGKALNLRVAPKALEFDVFCAPETNPEVWRRAFEPLGEVLTLKRLDVPAPAREARAIVTEARRLFNEHRFWEVHETLEGLWKEKAGAEKRRLQGIILLAAALVHAQKGDTAVVWTLLAQALQRLDDGDAVYQGWDVAALKTHFARALAAKKIDFPTV